MKNINSSDDMLVQLDIFNASDINLDNMVA